MKSCGRCAWWRVEMEEARPAEYGFCMADPPSVFCRYDEEDGTASMFYERPRTYESDFCSRFEARGEERGPG